MIDLSMHGYSHEKVLDLVQSSRGLRNMQYRVDILADGVKVGELNYQSCTIECSGLGEVKYLARITCEKMGYDYRTVTLQPVMFLEHGGHLFEFPFPPLMPVTVAERIEEGRTLQDIEAYDETVRIQENSIGEVLYIPKGSVYTAAIDDILRKAGFAKINIESSGLFMDTDREDWEESDYVLTIVNELLDEIGYLSLAVDRDGVLYSKKYEEPDVGRARIHYATGKNSVIHFSKQVENDGYKRPNRFIGIVFSDDMDEPWRYEYTNTDPAYPASVENLGYVITEVIKYNNIASYETLRDNVHRRASEAAASYEYATLSTAIMPHHGVREILTVQSEGVNGVYEEIGWRIDRFQPGGLMTHNLRKVIYS